MTPKKKNKKPADESEASVPKKEEEKKLPQKEIVLDEPSENETVQERPEAPIKAEEKPAEELKVVPVMPTTQPPESQVQPEQKNDDAAVSTEKIKPTENSDVTASAKMPELGGAPKSEEKKEASPAKTEEPKKKKKVKKGKGKLAGILTSINYIGMGKQRTAFIQSLATMLNAGLPLIDSLKTLELEVKNRAMKKVIQRITVAVENGSTLWRAMEAEYFFTPYEIALIRIGEEAGNLARNMEYLSEQEEKDHELRQKVKMAMIYPSIVLTLVFVIVMGLGMFVLPNLVQVLYSLNVELPITTRAVIFVTNIFQDYGTIAVPSMIGGALFILFLAKFTNFKVVTQWVVFHIPGIGSLAREATIARFGVILGGLLQAGVPLVESIRSLAEVTPIVSYRRYYYKLLERITLGDSFSKSFELLKTSKKILPISVQQLVVTGEKSGSLSEVLLKIADIYDKKASDTAKKLPVILEPMLLLFVGVLVGGIAFAIITPIYSVVGNVGR